MTLWQRLRWRLLGFRVLDLPPGAIVVFQLRQPLPLEQVARMREAVLDMVKRSQPTADVLILGPSTEVTLEGVVEPWPRSR